MPYIQKPYVVDCTELPFVEEEVIILFPSLGTPLMLAPGQTKASIFVAAPTSLQAKVQGQPLMEVAIDMYKLVDQHLRVVTIHDKHEKDEPDGATLTGTLFKEDRSYAAAKKHITGWRVGEFKAGALIRDRHGRPFATVAPAAAQLYDRVQDVYEIELDLDAAPFVARSAFEGERVAFDAPYQKSCDQKLYAAHRRCLLAGESASATRRQPDRQLESFR